LRRATARLVGATRDPLFAEVSRKRRPGPYARCKLPRRLLLPADADSEHVEGKFYVWTPRKCARPSATKNYAVCAPFFGLDRALISEGGTGICMSRAAGDIAKSWAAGAGMRCLLARARARLFERVNSASGPARREILTTGMR